MIIPLLDLMTGMCCPFCDLRQQGDVRNKNLSMTTDDDDGDDRSHSSANIEWYDTVMTMLLLMLVPTTLRKIDMTVMLIPRLMLRMSNA